MVIVFVMLVFVPVAFAQEAPHSHASVAPHPVAGHPIVDFRAGAGFTSTSGAPYMCLELAPIAILSVEGCGTGSGFLYPAMDEPDLAHFRARVRVLDTEKGAMEAGLVVGAGLAELQVGQDAPGFVVGDDSPTEGAGPELSVGVKGRVWLHPQVYLVGDITAGSAWMVAAPRLLDQESGFVPFGAITVGAGF